MTTGPNGPGFLGYLLNIGVSNLFFSIVVILPMVTVNGAPEAAVIYLPIGFVVISIVGFPVALAGVLAMELICRRIPAQGVHVAVGGVAGALATLVYLPAINLWMGPQFTPVFAVVVGMSAAIGRAAAIPMVERRREAAAVSGRTLARTVVNT